MMIKRIHIIYIILFLPISLFSQEVSSLEQEKSEPFSYYKNSVDQLGFKDCPEAMAVTNGGVFSNSFVGIEFLYGDSLKSATKRVILLENNYLPIIHFELKEGDISFKLEAFSAPENMLSQNNLITSVRWSIENNGKKSKSTMFGFKVIPLHETGWKEYIRHNRYCAPWYRDQFMEINTYENMQQTFRVEEACVYQGDHMILCSPEDFLADEADAGGDRQWSKSITLQAGASEELVFKIPVVPVTASNSNMISRIKMSDVNVQKKELVNFWENELDKITGISVPEQKVMGMFHTSYINLLNAKDLLADQINTIQRCNEFQYDYFYVRDNAYFARVYDMLGMHEMSHNILQPYFIYDIEGNAVHFRQRTGIYKKLCHDYWGQVLWAFGSHYRQTRNKELLEKVYELLPNHIKEFKMAVEKDPRGLWPASWPYDNEHINGHYTGHSFWALLGLRNAIFMAREMGMQKDADSWQNLYEEYLVNFKKELDEITAQTDGYIPPGMDDPEDGFDWANASAGLYPFEAIDKNDPSVRKTLETIRNYNYMEGVSTYSGCNAYVAKNLLLNNKDLPERGLHHYETFYVTNGNLVIGEQKKVVEDMYAILVHTSSTHGGFEWKPTPWGNRDPGFNRQPHGWCAARYIELIRNMLVREEGSDVHLLSAVSPEWIKEGETITLSNAPTYFGDVSYILTTGKNAFKLTLDAQWNNDLGKIYFHIPWFIQAESILVDGQLFDSSDDFIEISRDTKEIVVSWEGKFQRDLNFNEAVNIYLDKYHNRPSGADYTHLFPAMAVPGFNIDQTKEELTLFSPDNYANVYYTIDGSEPGPDSKIYTKPIDLKMKGVIKAVCVDINNNMSDCISINTASLLNLHSIR